MQRFTGIEYVYIDIANNFGLDKWAWKDRITWAKDRSIAELTKLTEIAEEPVLMTKAIFALKDALGRKPTGFVMSLDATASGIQLMACLTGCVTTGRTVNLINTGKREDTYQLVGDYMGVDKATVKKPVMTTYYGSTAQPKRVFGEGTEELKKFYNALAQLHPGAMQCLDGFQSLWDPTALEYKWKLPDGHTAVMKVMDTVDRKVEVDELDHATFTYRTKVNQPMEFGLALAANAIHSVDGYVVREMYRRAEKQGFEILTIHDSFIQSDAA